MAIKKLWLNNLQNTRKSVGRLIRGYHASPDEDIQRFRAEIYALKTLVDCFRLELDLELARRVEVIEDILEDPVRLTKIRRAN